ncbi:MAG TPA: hypothetical protein PKE06_03600 [Flavilitoribacter sp.]|nr:hypothetical protein [Flavilitoribacter sp.]HMQ87410.1 hypothetical protein [Flavilitoribacter sp.]
MKPKKRASDFKNGKKGILSWERFCFFALAAAPAVITEGDVLF